MRTMLSIKTLFRTKLKTLLTFMLLGATSYMLFFGIAEYAAVSRAMAQSIGFYKGIGAVEAEPPLEEIPDDFWPDYLPLDIWSPVSVYGLDFYLYADERVAYNPYGEEIRQYSYAGLSQSTIDTIAALPQVSRVSTRYMTAGVSPTLERSFDNDNYYLYSARFVAEATLYSVQQLNPNADPDVPKSYKLLFIDFTLLSGNQKLSEFFEGDDWRLAEAYSHAFGPEYEGDGNFPDASFQTNKTQVRIVLHGSEIYRSELYSTDFMDSLVPGERYVIIGRYTPIYMANTIGDVDISLSDPMTLDWCPQIYPLDDMPENYINLPEFAPLREMIEITEADTHTLDVVYADDMSTIMRFAEGSMQITDGRALTEDDSANKNNACVMNSAYMSENGLKIGDKIALRLGDELFDQNQSLGSVAVVRERYPSDFTEQEFEIVGAYRDVDTVANQSKNLHWAYSRNTVFVPQAFLPVDVPDDYIVRPGEFSFVIDDPRDITAFLEEARPIIEDELGLTLFFSDGGWSAVENQIRQAGASAKVRLAASCFSVAVAVCLTAYLFVWRKRKEYAVMRALGTPKRSANRSLSVPLAVLGLAATAVGSVLGRITAGSRIESVLAPFAEAGIATEASIPGYLVIVCFVLALAALAIFTAIMLRSTSAKQPLELLQIGEGQVTAKNGKKHVLRAEAETTAREMDERALEAAAELGLAGRIPEMDEHASGAATDIKKGGRIPEMDEHASGFTTDIKQGGHFPLAGATARKRARDKQGPGRHAVRYAARHIRRQPVKSLLSAGLALLIAGAVGQLTQVRGTYREMYRGLDQKAYIIDGITLLDAIESATFGQLSAVYFENSTQVLTCFHFDPTVVFTNDIERYSDGAVEIEFLDGYNYASQSKIDEPLYGPTNRTCVMDAGLMRRLGLELGDSVRLTDAYEMAALYREHFGLPPLDMDPVELQKNKESLDPLYDEISVFLTLVGSDVSGSAPNMVYLPMTRAIDSQLSHLNDKILDYAEYTLTSPEYAGEFNSFVEKKIKGPAVGDVGSPFMMDTSEADNILQKVRLLDMLYPIAAAISLVLSGLFPGLIVMQTDREAAIMRAIGATKKRARAMLTLEQATLCIAGLFCAAVLLYAINGAAIAGYIGAIGIYAAAQLVACVAGALICAVVATRRRVLELLQVKE
ncbi:MAG: ABC transporter permease [Oscillospiraceae bacterium]|nr:ABC transporter permease [Oscillospiraceae bacterium]